MTDPANVVRDDDPLTVALAAAADAERRAGIAEAELVETTERLSIAVSAQSDWDRLSAELVEDLRQCRERLQAVEDSRTWRMAQAGLAPYRMVRERLGR